MSLEAGRRVTVPKGCGACGGDFVATDEVPIRSPLVNVDFLLHHVVRRAVRTLTAVRAPLEYDAPRTLLALHTLKRFEIFVYFRNEGKRSSTARLRESLVVKYGCYILMR